MAFPEIRASAKSAVEPNQTSHTVNLPTCEAGDMLICLFTPDGLPTVTFPTGWTILLQPTNSAYCRPKLAYKVADGSEGSTMTVTTSVAEGTTHITIAIKKNTYQGIPEGSTYYYSAAYCNPPNYTASWGSDDNLWLAFGAYDGNKTLNNYPSNCVGLQEQANVSVLGTGCAAAKYDTAATATFDPATFGLSASAYAYGLTVVLRGAAIVPNKVGLTIDNQVVISESAHVNIDGVWKNVVAIFTNINGVWKQSEIPNPPPATVVPTISGVTDDGNTVVYWTVTNNASTAALIRTEVNDNTPDLYTWDLNAGLSRQFSHDMGIMPTSLVIYATAQATGENESNYISYGYNP